MPGGSDGEFPHDVAETASPSESERRDLVPEGLAVDTIRERLEADAVGEALMLTLGRLERELGFVIMDRHDLTHEQFLDDWREASFGKFVKLCLTLDYIEDPDAKDTLDLLGRYRARFLHDYPYMRTVLEDPDERPIVIGVIESGLDLIERLAETYH